MPSHYFSGLLSGLLVSFCAFVGLAYCQLGAPTVNSFWTADIKKRKSEAAQAIQKPKLLLVGGSGALFGLNAKHLEACLNYPTVNFGTHAALGTAYILELARWSARPGDTVLLALEYELYSNKKTTNAVFSDFIMSRDVDYFLKLSLLDQLDIFMHTDFARLRMGLKSKTRPLPEPIYPAYSPYDPKNVDAHGDMTGATHARAESQAQHEVETSGTLRKGLTIKDEEPNYIKSFLAWSKANNVRVLATFPNLCNKPVYEDKIKKQVEDTLKEFYTSHGVPLIGSLANSLLPRGDFFDTCYHLTEEAALKRTDRLVPLLKPFFEASKDSMPTSPPSSF